VLTEYVGCVVPGNTHRNLLAVVAGRYAFVQAMMLGMEKADGTLLHRCPCNRMA
jgi:hypothetical protein